MIVPDTKQSGAQYDDSLNFQMFSQTVLMKVTLVLIVIWSGKQRWLRLKKVSSFLKDGIPGAEGWR